MFLIFCLLVPLFPGKAAAQLLLNPVKLSEMSDAKTGAGDQATPVSSASDNSSFDLTQYVPEAKITDDYRLGPGDQLEVHLIVGDNALALDYNFVVNPEGKIFFPNIGEISLSDITLNQAKARMVGKIKSKYREAFDLSLMVAKPKLIKIYVTGQISKPGLYKAYDGSRVSEIIKAIGVAKGGSERKIAVKRGDETLSVDLYKVWYQGDIKSDVGIRMGDVIDIPPMGSARVSVMGEVPRPGQYELKDGERLKDALAMAGYVGVNSALSEVAYLKREKGKENFENYKLNLYSMFLKGDDSQNIELHDGDIVSVPSIRAYIYVYGEVGKPGRFELQPGSKLSDYVNLAGGPTVKANLSSVSITRQENGKAKVYNINMSEVLQKGNLKYDVELYGGDVVFVPGNFFYFSDFGSFASTIFTAIALYNIFTTWR
jgi:protein involved in polysaccharide export with SLBB domain